jgi:hypothetical protein
MNDIIAVHRSDLVDAVTGAVTPLKAELAECKKVRDGWCKEYTEQRDDAIALTKRCAVLETAIRMVIARTNETALANELRFILRGSANDGRAEHD